VPAKQKLIQKERPRVLVAPMDWGLGHATRCIPLVSALQNLGIEVIIAAEGAQLSLLQKEFSHLNFIHLQGYRIQYSNSKRLLPIKIAFQVPKILLTIRREHNWLKKRIKDLNIDAVISDNRYGLYNKDILSVFITHQLTIDTPLKSLTSLLQLLNYKRIENFDECWVPDFADAKLNIAGKLSHPKKKPKLPVHYIGLLSRFTGKKEKSEYDHLALISGPEPQRSLFEHKIRKYFPYLNGKKTMVLGKPDKFSVADDDDNIEIRNHVEARQLETIIASSKNIVCRAGYSTIMDLIAMKRTALLVPTPGQTEQEYLAERLSEQQWFSTTSQNDLNAAVITQAADRSLVIPEFEQVDLNAFLKEFLNRIAK
jgi:predicted glycosyltransferase